MSDNTSSSNSVKSPDPESFGDSSSKKIHPDGYKYEETKVDDSAAKERLGRDIYTDKTQAFEEMFSNGITAIQDATTKGFLSESDGKILIELQKDSDGQVSMTFRDNGIGMDEDIVRDVFLTYGVTTGGKSKDDVAAMFGMGVASYPNLVGFHEGQLYMETNPRYGGEPISGYYSIDGLAYKKGAEELQLLDEDTYGTAYHIQLQSGVSVSDARNWVERVSGYNTVPIEVRYGDEERELIEPSTVYDKFDMSESLYIEYSDPKIGKFVAGHNVPEETILLHRGIDFDLDTNIIKPPFKSNIFIRLHTESEKVCEGEHKGKIVLDDVKYDNIDEEDKSDYIPRSEVSEDVAVTPRVVGNRESLSGSEAFSRWICEKLRETHYNRVERCLSSVKCRDDFFKLDKKEANYLHFALSDNAFAYPYKYDNFKQKMKESQSKSMVKRTLEKHTSSDFEISDDTVTVLSALFDQDSIKNVQGLSSNKSEVGWAVDRDREHKDTTVYMGVSINDKKKQIVREDDPNCIIVRVGSAKTYELYEDVFGWEKLKKVSKKTLDQFDVSENTKSQFTNKAKGSGKSLIIHYGSKSRYKKKMTPSFIREALESETDALYGEPIIAFPKSATRNISDYYNFRTKSSGLFKCKDSTWESLKEYPEVRHIDEVILEHKEVERKSSSGTIPIEEALRQENYTIICMPNEKLAHLIDIFGDRKEVAQRFKKVISSNSLGRSRYISDTNNEVLVLSATELLNNHFVFADIKTNNIFGLFDPQTNSDLVNVTKFSRENLYTVIGHLSLAEWTHTDMYEEITSTIISYNDPMAVISNTRTALQNGEFTDPQKLKSSQFDI